VKSVVVGCSRDKLLFITPTRTGLLSVIGRLPVRHKRYRGRSNLSEYSIEDWREAIYIDFEGRVKDPPTLLGMCCRDNWDVEVLEPLLWQAVEYGHPKGDVFSATPLNAYEVIRDGAVGEGRLVVAWSSRELDAILKNPGITSREASWWSKNLIDGKKHAKKMARKLAIKIESRKSSMGKGENKNSLASFMKATGYKVPAIHGPGNTSQRILYVRNQVLRKGNFDEISSSAKTKWTNVLSHNYHDCVGLRHVMVSLSEMCEAKHRT